MGAASNVWLYHSLKAFAKDLKTIGLTLILKKGDPDKALEEVKKESGAQIVFSNEPNLL